METWLIGGQVPRERLRRQVERECAQHGYGEQPPSNAQIAMVLHALADHTSLMQAVGWRRGEGPWPEATSVGRWLHHYGDHMRDSVWGWCTHCGDGTEEGDDPRPDLCAMCVKAGRN